MSGKPKGRIKTAEELRRRDANQGKRIGKTSPMTRDPNPAAQINSADAAGHSEELRRLKRMLDETDGPEVFPTAVRQRFGKLISAAVAKPKSKRR